jgi:serine/threonine-protein kinase HipA
MTKELIAIIEGREMGRLVRDKTGKLSFAYNEQWRDAPHAYPLSISMPLALSEHGNAKIDPFLWGLLPDNANVLDHWARRFPCLAPERLRPNRQCRRGLCRRGPVCPT